MKKKMLGNSGIEVSPFALGGNVFGWTINKEQSFRILDAYMAHGFELIDTADVYSTWGPGNHGGESETIIGHWMKQQGNRQKVIIATKVGKPMSPEKKGLSKKYILQAVDESLRRLQTDFIDLYQSHEDDPQTPLEETMDAFSVLIREGKIRAAGASNYSPDRLSESLRISNRYGYARYETLQPAYNLYTRKFESDYETWCLKEKIGVLCYYPLAGGFLTGKYRLETDLAKSARGPGIKKYLNDRGLRILDALDELAMEHKMSPAILSIAWILNNPAITAPIASATSISQLDELLKGVSAQLNEKVFAELNEASAV